MLFAVGLFFVLISPAFLSDGMFMDGLYYATISKNLAEHFGTFWAPEFTETNPWGYGHPPLAFLFQSIPFHISKSLLVAKIYSVCTYLCCGLLMYWICRELDMKRHHFWFVLVLWITVPLVSWGATNNLLENTMAVFVLLSVIFYLKSLKTKRFLMLACAGLMLFLAFLTKGFTGLYPLAFPAICWLFVRNTTFKDMVIDTFVILLFMTLPFVLIWFFNPAAQHFFKKYFTFQIVRSIQSVQTVDSRFYIVFRFFREMILPIVIVGSILLIAVRQKVFKDSLSSTRNRWALAFLFLTLAGVLPIMISLKQSSFYILTVFPLISIGLGLFAESFLENISLGLKFKTVCRVLTICVIIAAIGANVFFAGKIGRDKELLTDIYALLPEMEEHDVITINNDLIVNYSAGAYFYFLKKVSLDPYNHHEYLLCTQPVDDPNYELYRKAPNDLLLYRQTSPEK